jgi:hypothetical protein
MSLHSAVLRFHSTPDGRDDIFLQVAASRFVGSSETQRERAVGSHISRKTSEMWGTRRSLDKEKEALRG